MATVVTELKTRFTSDSSNFVRGVNTSRRSAKRFESSIKSVSGNIGGMVKGLVAAGGAYLALSTTIRNVSNEMERLDKLGKMSDKLDLDVSFIQGVQDLGDKQGVIIDLNTVFGKLNKTIGDAQSGNKAAMKAFSDVGLSVDDLKNKKPEQVFRAISNSIASVPDKAIAASRASAIFGRSGVELINVLSQGESAIDSHIANLERLGALRSREEIRSIEQSNDQLDNLNKAYLAFASNVAVVVSPALERWGETLSGNAANANASGESIRSLQQDMHHLAIITERSGNAIAFVIHETSAIITGAVAGFLWSIKKLGEGANSLGADFDLSGINTAHQDMAIEFEHSTEKMRASWDAMIAPIEAYEAKVNEAGKTISESFTSMSNQEMFDLGIIGEIPLTPEQIEKRTQAYHKMHDSLSQARIERTEYEKELMKVQNFAYENNLTDEQREQLINQVKLNEQFKERKKLEQEQLELAKKREEATKREQDRLKSLARSVKESLQTPFQKAQKEVQKLYMLLIQGELTQAEFDKASKNAVSGLAGERANKQNELLLAGIREQSTTSFAESQKLQFRASTGITRQQTLQERGVKLQETTNQILDEIKSNIADGNLVTANF